MRRYADTFFRHRLLTIFPFLVLLPAAILYSRSSVATATETANVWAIPSGIAQLGYSDQYLPPAQNLSNSITQLLGSRSFDRRVAGDSPLYSRGSRSSLRVVADLSKNVLVTAQGPNIVTLAYKNPNAVVAAQVLHAVLKEAGRELNNLNRTQNSKEMAADKTHLASVQAHLKQSTQALGQYMTAKSIPAKDMAAQALFDPNFATLYQAVQSSQIDVQNAEEQLAQIGSQSNNQAIFQVIDQPSFATISSRKKTAILDVMIALVVSLLLSGGFLAVKTTLDRSLRYADEVPELVGIPVLGVIPYSPILAKQSKKIG